MITHPETLEQLSERIDELEMRVRQLEQSSSPRPEIAPPSPVPQIKSPQENAPGFPAGATLTVLGKALLGIAGAYMLRALSGVVPRGLLAVVAGVYAVAWLVAGARVIPNNRLAGVFYVCTSLLILTPMLWEMTIRFHAMPAIVAAAAIAAYLAATWVFARQPGRSSAFSIAWAGSAVTALALSIGTHDMASFTAILLAMVACGEAARVTRQPIAVSPIVFLASDTAVWALLFLYRMPAETRPDYPPLSPLAVIGAPLLLFAIHATGTAIHTGLHGFRLSAFDTMQSVLGLVLTGCAFFWLAPEFGQPALGALCVLLSIACYAAAFGPFQHAPDPHNFRVFAAWGAALLLCSGFLLLPRSAASVALAVLSLAALYFSARMRTPALEYHGVLFLTVAAWASGLLEFAFSTLAGKMPAWPPLPVISLSIATLLACAACREQPGEPVRNQLLHYVPALLAATALCALVTLALMGAVRLAFSLDVFHIAFLRTLTLCSVAFVFALGGSRLNRPAMKRVAYTLIALVAAKLLFEDLRHGRLEFIAASICLVALTLILVPRLTSRIPRRGNAS